MTLATPLNFDYSQLPQSIPSSKKTRRFQPENSSSFSPNTTSVIRIPIRDMAYLDGSNSYLKFTLTNGDSVASLALDPNASAVISRVRVLVGGVVAEDIERANVLVNLLTQSQGSEDYHKTLQIVSGQSIVDQDSSNLLGGASISPGGSKTLCIPIFSGLLSCGKYLPLGLFQSNSLTLELYLESTNSVGVWDQAPTSSYTVSNVEYIASLIEIHDDQVNNALKNKLMSEGLEFHGSTYTAHINSMASGSSASINIPERCKSLKGLMTVVRPNSSIGGSAHASLQTRYPHTTAGENFSWYYRIGAENMPQVAVGSSAESFLEFQKAYNHLFSLSQSTYANFSRWNTGFASNANAGCFNMTISTESFGHTNSMESGLDTATSAMPISLQISQMLTNDVSEVISFAYKDIIWRFDNTGRFEVSL